MILAGAIRLRALMRGRRISVAGIFGGGATFKCGIGGEISDDLWQWSIPITDRDRPVNRRRFDGIWQTAR